MITELSSIQQQLLRVVAHSIQRGSNERIWLIINDGMRVLGIFGADETVNHYWRAVSVEEIKRLELLGFLRFVRAEYSQMGWRYEIKVELILRALQRGDLQTAS